MLVAYNIGLSFRAACARCHERKINGRLHVLDRFDKRGCYKQVSDKQYAVLEAMAVEWYVYDSARRERLKKLGSAVRQSVGNL